VVERMVVKPTMIVVAAESHDREEKRENSLQKKKTWEEKVGFFSIFGLVGFFSIFGLDFLCSSHEIHSYLLWGGKG